MFLVNMKPIVFKMGGEAGFGITSAGLVFSKIASRSGYKVFDYMEYPSIIRGGHNVVGCYISKDQALAPYKHTDLLVALNQETVDLHAGELSADGILIYDGSRGIVPRNLPKKAAAISVPLAKIAIEVGGTILMRDTVAIGAALALWEGEMVIFAGLIREQFERKGEEVVKKNIDTAKAGYDYVVKHFPTATRPLLPKIKGEDQLVLNSNEAIALAAVAAGMQFCAIYPMTPTSNILHVLASLQKQYNFVYKQPEDEISAINMAIGAAFAGARTMVATAGGGFCLMTEGYGLAGMTETPLVIIEGMRPGPATGLPTWSGQGDLQFILHAHQDDFPRIVLAAGDVKEAFELTMEAFNLAEIYQTPVVVIVDKHLCDSHASVPVFNYSDYEIDRGKFSTKKVFNYKRYALAADGISPRIPAGTGTHVIGNSDEHDEFGFSSESAENRVAQVKKRAQKMLTCERVSMPKPALFGPLKADLTVVSWGSNKGAILEALNNFPNVNFLHIAWMSPFPRSAVINVLGGAKKVLVVEGNQTGQLKNLIAEHTGFRIENEFLKFDGRPIYPEEITQKINELLKAKKL